MATIRENKSKGKVVSYQFILFLGRDEQGKQMRKYLTWTPPDGLTPAKQRKAAEQAAKQWEKRIREDPRDEQEEPRNAEYTAPPERKDDFVSFVNETWFALFICNGDRKETTTVFYADIASYITKESVIV